MEAPYLEIVEQPKANGLRFRYATEGEKAGSISGANSTSTRQTYPAVKVICLYLTRLCSTAALLFLSSVSRRISTDVALN